MAVCPLDPISFAGLIEVSRLLLLGVRIDWVTACWIDRVLLPSFD